MIRRIVKMTFQEDKVADFQRLFDEKKAKIRSFPGCQHLELLRCKNPNTIFFTYSYWDNEESLHNYRYSELFKETWKNTKILFSDKPEAWSTEMQHEL